MPQAADRRPPIAADAGVGLIGAAEVASCTFPLVEAGGSSGGAGRGDAHPPAGSVLGRHPLGHRHGGQRGHDDNQRLRFRVTPTVIPTASSDPQTNSIGAGFLTFAVL